MLRTLTLSLTPSRNMYPAFRCRRRRSGSSRSRSGSPELKARGVFTFPTDSRERSCATSAITTFSPKPVKWFYRTPTDRITTDSAVAGHWLFQAPASIIVQTACTSADSHRRSRADRIVVRTRCPDLGRLLRKWPTSRV
jgi:hypothetical protein